MDGRLAKINVWMVSRFIILIDLTGRHHKVVSSYVPEAIEASIIEILRSWFNLITGFSNIGHQCAAEVLLRSY